MRAFSHIAVVLMISLFAALAFAGDTDKPVAPSKLPEAYSAGAGKLVMLDFYSPFCSTCQAMEPYVKQIKAESGDKIVFHRIDLADPKSEELALMFDGDGTPAYFLFDDTGTLLYQMDNMIIPKLLRPKVLGYADLLKPQVFPKELAISNDSARFMLLSFTPDNCPPCTETNKYLEAMAFAEDDELKIVNLSSQDKPVKQLMSDVGLQQTPSYILYDSKTRELMRFEGEIDPKIFWQYYSLLAHNTPITVGK